ncbi:MAG TPA: hypothetical protein VHW23_19930 [Kofleriaceae bacterium]|jgi:hypothetical protein|nr:hypothetical protein [Kofleriaceae bacterium]
MLQSWAEHDQCAVRLLLHRIMGESVVHDRMFHNLLAESQFSAADIAELLELLHALAAQGASIDEVCGRLREFCTASPSGTRRTLRGRRAQVGAETLGRVMPLSTFARLLVRARYHTDEEEAQFAIRAMLGARPEDYTIDWRSYPLGSYAIWSTFDEAGGRPFGDDLPSAAELLERLGLEPKYDGDLLLVLEYRLPADVTSRVPSFCDAYVGREWNAWFRVSAHEAPFGRTRPVGAREARGAPEVIHDVITASALAAPIHYRV